MQLQVFDNKVNDVPKNTMTDEQLEKAGIPPTLIRYSCGLENAEDLIDDIAQALEKV